jgi:hypothetical protein
VQRLERLGVVSENFHRAGVFLEGIHEEILFREPLLNFKWEMGI